MMDYTVNDLIGAIDAGHARETEDVFAALVDTRVQEALATRKQEIASNMFTSVEESVGLDEAIHIASTKVYGKTHIAHIHTEDGSTRPITFGVGKNQDHKEVADRLAKGLKTTVKSIEPYSKPKK
jgi:hypothetical protein